jgi:hypothetical protein
MWIILFAIEMSFSTYTFWLQWFLITNDSNCIEKQVENLLQMWVFFLMYMHQLGDLFTWVAMLHILFNLIMKPKKIFFFLYIFSHEKNQIFIICNGFVGAKLDLHLQLSFYFIIPHAFIRIKNSYKFRVIKICLH